MSFSFARAGEKSEEAGAPTPQRAAGILGTHPLALPRFLPPASFRLEPKNQARDGAHAQRF